MLIISWDNDQTKRLLREYGNPFYLKKIYSCIWSFFTLFPTTSWTIAVVKNKEEATNRSIVVSQLPMSDDLGKILKIGLSRHQEITTIPGKNTTAMVLMVMVVVVDEEGESNKFGFRLLYLSSHWQYCRGRQHCTNSEIVDVVHDEAKNEEIIGKDIWKWWVDVDIDSGFHRV